MAGTFVGRDRELGGLLELITDVARGRSAAALVIGEPGIGKSRLLAELASASHGLRVLRVTGYEPEREVALAGVRDLLHDLSTVPAGAPISQLIGSASEPARRPSAAGLQLRLFEAAHRARVSIGPALLIVDDAQWLDPASRALCHYLFRAARRPVSAMAVVIGGRQVRETRSMWAAVARVASSRRLRIDLEPIPLESARRLAADLAPGSPDAEVELAWRRSGGSPFWFERLLAGEAEATESVLDGVASLGDSARSTLEVLAVAARPMPPDGVASVVGWDVDRTRGAVRELTDAGFVRDHGHETAVAHDLIREIVVNQIARHERRALHGAVAAWLGRRADDLRSLLEALGHVEAAGSNPADLAVRIATAPDRRLVGEEGLVRLDAIATSCSLADRRCRELHAAVARLAVELGDYPRAYARWLSLTEVDADPSVVLGAARSALELGRRDEAWRLLERAAESASEDAVQVEVSALRSALMRHLERRPAEAAQFADDAVRLARRLAGADRRDAPPDVRDAYVSALVVAVDAALMNDDIERMLALADELAGLTAATHPRTHVDAVVSGALARRLMGRNRDAEDRLARAWDLATAQVMPQAILDVGALRGIVLLTLGRLDEAEAISRELLALGRRLAERRPSRVFTLILPHLLELARGDWRRAAEALDHAARREPDAHYRLHGHLERAVAIARIDPRRADDVRRSVQLAADDAAVAGCRRCHREVLARGAEALARIGDVDAARGQVGQLDDSGDASDRDWSLAWWLVRARSVLAATSTPSASRTREELERVLGSAEEQGLVLEAIWCRLDIARTLKMSDRSAAAVAAREAGESAWQIGARTEAQLAEQILRALGVRTWRRTATVGRGGGPRLTERERQVVAMVRAGATNPEIASALFLSRKTVERHLSNVMARLGVRNRAELVAAMERAAPAAEVEGPPR